MTAVKEFTMSGPQSKMPKPMQAIIKLTNCFFDMRCFKIKCAAKFTKIGKVKSNKAANGTEMPSIDLKYKVEKTA